MKQLMLAAFVAVVTFAATTAVLRSHPPVVHRTASLSSQEINPPAERPPLSAEVVDDMTLVSPTESRR
jgi:hypothetical protein